MNHTYGKNEKMEKPQYCLFFSNAALLNVNENTTRLEPDCHLRKQIPCSPSSLCSASSCNKAVSFDSREKISNEMKLLAKNLKQKLIPSFILAVKCDREQAGSKFCWTLGPDPAKPYSRLSSTAIQACSGRAWRIQLPFSEDLHPAELTCWIYFWMHLLSCCLHRTSFHQPDFTAQRDRWSVFLVKRIYRKEDLKKKKKEQDPGQTNKNTELKNI